MRFCVSLVVAAVVGCLLVDNVEASISYSVAGSNHTENFNALPSTPLNSNLPWTNNSTLSGWYSNRGTFRVSVGVDTTGSLYSFGPSGGSDRALGSQGSGSANPVQFGVLFVNNTGVTLNNFTISFVGEQWRVGGTAAVSNSLSFSYQIGTGLVINVGSYTGDASLDFISPVAAGPAGASDGNSVAFQDTVSGSVSNVIWAPGQELLLRWEDIDNASSDHGLAIDDFTFSANVASTGVVPEPAALFVWGGIGLVGVGLAVYKKTVA